MQLHNPELRPTAGVRVRNYVWIQLGSFGGNGEKKTSEELGGLTNRRTDKGYSHKAEACKALLFAGWVRQVFSRKRGRTQPLPESPR